MSRKLEEKQRRREAEERKRLEQKRAARKRNLITMAVLVLVLAGVGMLIFREQQKRNQPIGAAAAEAGCSEVQTPELQDADHIAEGSSHAPYSSDPPTSGPHYEQPADPSFYPPDGGVAAEQLVHNLEHGFIVIWYRPDASEQTLDDLRDIVDQQPTATIANPYGGIPDGANYVLTAWGAMQSCEKVSQEVIDNFRREFQGQGPEKVVPAFEG